MKKLSDIELKSKLRNIQLFAFDVDGVLTDGSLTFDENGIEYKTFNAKDGQGILMLHKAGIKTAIITARHNGTIQHRAKTLGILELYQGQKNKAIALQELAAKFNLNYSQIAYMGDDIPDICVLEKVGLACAPCDAVDEVLQTAQFITSKCGGRGAVRELCDLILHNKKTTKE